MCPWLLRELVERGLWDEQMKNMIIAHNGSVQNIPNIPDDVKAIYKTVWEISQKKVIDLAADRGAFICQSQSMNIHLAAPTLGQLTSMHFYGWKKGLKTGMYYLRTRPAAQAIQFTVDQSVLKNAKAQSGGATNSLTKSDGVPITASPPSASGVSSSVVASQSPVMANGARQPPRQDSVPSPQSSSSIVPPGFRRTEIPQPATTSADERTRNAAEADPEFAAALQRQKEREQEEAKLLCSIENKDACLMCSG